MHEENNELTDLMKYSPVFGISSLLAAEKCPPIFISVPLNGTLPVSDRLPLYETCRTTSERNTSKHWLVCTSHFHDVYWCAYLLSLC